MTQPAPAPVFTCVLLGEEPLLAHCGALLLELGHRIVGVVTTNAENQRFARERGLPLWERATWTARLEETPTDLIFSITWPWRIPAPALARARRLAVNLHDGPLPRYAGLNGSAWAILRGEARHAVVWHVMTHGLDEGDILTRRDVTLDPGETAVSLHMKNASAAVASFLELVNDLEAGTEKRTPQDRTVERFTLSRHDRPDGLAVLDLRLGASELQRLVRACDYGPYTNPFAAAKLLHAGRAITVDEVALVDADPGHPPGTISAISDERLTVVCGSGALAIVRARTLDGSALPPAAAAAHLGVAVGDRVVDDTLELRARWSRRVAEEEPFFLKRLTAVAALEALELPLMRPRGDDARAAARLEVPLLAPSHSAEDAGGRSGGGVDAALLAKGGAPLVAAFVFVGASLCGRDEVALAWQGGQGGAAAEARTRLAPLLMPTLPLLVPVDERAGFGALVEQVEHAMQGVASKVGVLRDLVARTPALAGLRERGVSPLGVVRGGIDVAPTTAVALVLSSDGAHLSVDTAQVTERDARDLAARITRVARRLLDDPDRPLSTVDLLDDDERERVVFAWNATERPFPAEERVHEAFERQVDSRPDALAVVCESQRASFAALESRANRVAHALRARGARPGTFVAVCLPRGIDLVAALLGVAKTGAAWVPIDDAYPRERACFMSDDAQVILVVTTDKLAERFTGLPILMVDGAEVRRASDERVACPARATDVCYAMYTSGSAGTPKAVLVPHRAVINALAWTNARFQVGPDDRLLFVTSPSFDVSVYDVFGALGAGAVVEVASRERLAEPALLVRRIVEGGVTVWDSAPPALARLVPFLPSRAPQSTLRLVLLSGDTVPLTLPEQLRAVFPAVALTNLGGATEAAIWFNFHEIGSDESSHPSIPVGRPIDNTRSMVLDRRLRPVPPRVTGELVIGGVCLAHGYLGRPELTAERFVPDPFRPGERIYKTGDRARFRSDGTLELLGRSDLQVKIRGFRVEPGEVERVLGAQPGVRQAVVVPRADASGQTALVAYVVAHEGYTLDTSALKSALAARVPDFMVPAFITALPRLPVTQNGKLDRAALPAPAGAGAQSVPPRTPTERELVRIWSELLRPPAMGVTDSFFDLGGHSLLAVMLVTRMRAALGVDVPLARLLAHPTIEALAREVDRRRAAEGPPEHALLVPLRERGTKPPLFLVAGIGGDASAMRDLALRLPDDQPVYAVRAAGADDDEVPRDSIEELARASEPEILAAARGRPVVLGGSGFGALVAFELVRRLRRRGVPIVRVVLLDVFAPGYPRKAALLMRALLHARHLAQLDARGRGRYVVDRLGNVARRTLIRHGLGALVAPREDKIDDAKQRQLRALWAVLAQAQERYAPGGADDGPVTLFRASVDPAWPGVRFDDDTHGWRRFVTGPLEVIRLRGSHLDVFAPDNLDVIGRVLTERLTGRGGSSGS